MLAPRVHGHGQLSRTGTRLVFAVVTNTRAPHVRVAPPLLFDFPLHLRVSCTFSHWAVGMTGPVYPSDESRECILLAVYTFILSSLVPVSIPFPHM
jgi:hypothetical protein